MTAVLTTLRSKRWWLYARLAFFVAVPVILLLLPADTFDQGQSLCLSMLLFKQQCYACGMTKAVMHLIHLDFEDAVFYNMLSFAVLPLLAYLWAKWAWLDWKQLKVLQQHPT
jgi:hypothetical protein